MPEYSPLYPSVGLYGGYDNSKEWNEKYGQEIDKLDYIDLDGKFAVLSGDYTIEDMLEKYGTTVREKISGKTDYLFVDPAYSGWGKVSKVRDMRAKGDTKIKVVLASDLRKLIEEDKYNSSAKRLASEKQAAEELKKQVDSSIDHNKVGYGIQLALMTYLINMPEECISNSERLKIEEFLISKEISEILGTNLNGLLDVYKDDATKILLECIESLKKELDSSLVREKSKLVKKKGNEVSIDFKEIMDGTLKALREV